MHYFRQILFRPPYINHIAVFAPKLDFMLDVCSKVVLSFSGFSLLKTLAMFTEKHAMYGLVIIIILNLDIFIIIEFIWSLFGQFFSI